MADFADTLSRVPLFEKLSKKELKRIAGQMSERTFSAGETITAEGEGGVGFFVIEDGDATVTVKGGQVGTLGPGDYFGEIALIDKGPRSATIVADTEMRCRGMTSWEFRPMVQENSEMAWPLLEALVGRLRETEKRASG